jgi:uncharacterized membrane protein
MPRIPVLIIAFFFLAGGIGHFVAADFFVAIMPDYLPWHWELVIISGVFELMGAIGILIPRTRLLAAYGLIVLCVAVFPANLNMALHPEKFADIPVLFLYLRLPLQLLLIAFIGWAVKPERIARQNVKS